MKIIFTMFKIVEDSVIYAKNIKPKPMNCEM